MGEIDRLRIENAQLRSENERLRFDRKALITVFVRVTDAAIKAMVGNPRNPLAIEVLNEIGDLGRRDRTSDGSVDESTVASLLRKPRRQT